MSKARLTMDLAKVNGMLNEDDVQVLRTKYESFSSSLCSDCIELIRIQSKTAEDEALRDIRSCMDKFKTLIQDAKPDLELYLKTAAPDYNIFKILGVWRYEVRTHTPLLNDLLSPSGSHSQGTLFLRLFLEQVVGFSEPDVSHPSWYTQKETEFIDLRICNDALKRAVFIENKIDYVAHSGQLSRSFTLWKERYSGGAFIYLTINGDKPSDEGFDDAVYPKSEIDKEMILKSYRRDIKKWLTDSLDKIHSDKVRYTISQYLDSINSL